MVLRKRSIGSPLSRQLENSLRMSFGTSWLIPLSKTIGKDTCAARKRQQKLKSVQSWHVEIQHSQMELRHVKFQGPQRATHGGHRVTLVFEESCPGFKAADIIVDAENAISFTHAAPASINPTDVEHPPELSGQFHKADIVSF